MTVRLRGHHLLCVLTFAGEGYDGPFVANFARVADRLAAGEEVLVVEGPDDVCAPLLEGDAPHCLLPRVGRRDALAVAGVCAVLGRPVAAGDRLTLAPAQVRRLRDAFAAGTVRAACAGCEWSDLCSSIAGAGFAGTRL